jgi:DNA invertase Pin-like site-specific DNA recombinase
MANKTKRAAIYLRVSTSGQTVENQRRELEQNSYKACANRIRIE